MSHVPGGNLQFGSKACFISVSQSNWTCLKQLEMPIRNGDPARPCQQDGKSYSEKTGMSTTSTFQVEGT